MAVNENMSELNYFVKYSGQYFKWDKKSFLSRKIAYDVRISNLSCRNGD